MRRLVFLRAAQSDLDEIFWYVADREQDYRPAENLYADILKKSEAIAGTPGIGRARPEFGPDLRSFPYQNYVIFYRLVGEGVEIVNVFHAARDIDTLMDDTE